MDNADRMPPLGAVKPRQKFFDVIHRAAPISDKRISFRTLWRDTQQANVLSPPPMSAVSSIAAAMA
jgi:hypothetical protein